MSTASTTVLRILAVASIGTFRAAVSLDKGFTGVNWRAEQCLSVDGWANLAAFEEARRALSATHHRRTHQ